MWALFQAPFFRRARMLAFDVRPPPTTLSAILRKRGDKPKATVALRGRCLGRLARHGRGTRRQDDGCCRMASGDRGGHAVLVVGAVGGERRHRCHYLVE